MMGAPKKIGPGFLDEGTKISLMLRGPIKYLSSRPMAWRRLAPRSIVLQTTIVLRGAVRASDAAMARDGAQAPLRARVPQRPCDHGLFSDDRLQGDLIAMASRRHG
jgi:hypothetical protein